MTLPYSALIEQIRREVPNGAGLAISEAKGELRIDVDPQELHGLLTFLRDDSAAMFKVLTSICGVDYPEREKRFEVVYNLLSLHQNLRLRVHVSVNEEGTIPSVTNLYSAAGWFEREVWDMYGVLFTNHDDLRRILTDYGFAGHPLRKDFPLTGYVEVRYDHEKKRVVYEPVKLDQEFRYFDNLSPWDGTSYVIPGEEKTKDEKVKA